MIVTQIREVLIRDDRDRDRDFAHGQARDVTVCEFVL